MTQIWENGNLTKAVKCKECLNKFCQLHDPLTLQVTHAAPHPQGVPLHPTVGVAEAVVMTTMAAVPGMDMAVVRVIPAVEVTHTPIVVVNVRVDKRGGHPLLREAILLENTATQAAGHLGVVGVEVAGQIEGWPGIDIEMDLNGEMALSLMF